MNSISGVCDRNENNGAHEQDDAPDEFIDLSFFHRFTPITLVHIVRYVPLLTILLPHFFIPSSCATWLCTSFLSTRQAVFGNVWVQHMVRI